MIAKHSEEPTSPSAAMPDVCACLSFRMASRAVTQQYDAILQASGLRATQYSLLRAAALSGGPTLSALAKMLVMDRTTLTRNLKPLVDQGLIALAEGTDRRSRAITLTARGRHKLAAADALWEEAQRRFIAGIGESHWSALLEGLRSAVAAARAMPLRQSPKTKPRESES